MKLIVRKKGDAAKPRHRFNAEASRCRTILNAAIRNAIESAAEQISYAAADLNQTKGSEGQLARSFRAIVRSRALRGTVDTATPYARALNYGARIAPRGRKYLLVPLPGVRGRPRAGMTMLPLKNRARGFLLASGKGRRLKARFLLLKSVKLRARGFIEEGIAIAKPGERVHEIMKRGMEEGAAIRAGTKASGSFGSSFKGV